MEWLLVGVALLLACALVFVPKLNVFTDTVLTLYHEIGHNVVLLGFFLVGARPCRDWLSSASWQRRSCSSGELPSQSC